MAQNTGNQTPGIQRGKYVITCTGLKEVFQSEGFISAMSEILQETIGAEQVDSIISIFIKLQKKGAVSESEYISLMSLFSREDFKKKAKEFLEEKVSIHVPYKNVGEITENITLSSLKTYILQALHLGAVTTILETKDQEDGRFEGLKELKIQGFEGKARVFKTDEGIIFTSGSKDCVLYYENIKVGKNFLVFGIEGGFIDVFDKNGKYIAHGPKDKINASILDSIGIICDKTDDLGEEGFCEITIQNGNAIYQKFTTVLRGSNGLTIEHGFKKIHVYNTGGEVMIIGKVDENRTFVLDNNLQKKR